MNMGLSERRGTARSVLRYLGHMDVMLDALGTAQRAVRNNEQWAEYWRAFGNREYERGCRSDAREWRTSEQNWWRWASDLEAGRV